jgi:Methyltransferase domain
MKIVRPAARKVLGGTSVYHGRLFASYSLARSSFLTEYGWFRSFSEASAVDARGAPLPWLTYPAIFFLRDRVQPDWEVFEYGSGNSTLWWASRVRRVVSCEHDDAWCRRIAGLVPGNCELIRAPLSDPAKYAETIGGADGPFNVVVIDGRHRVECARRCLSHLKDDGVVLWDDGNREEYGAGFRLLADAGFRRIDFWGPGPIAPVPWCTSVFYRDGNCLEI